METAAYHEAGHAVVASILGGKVVSVSIESESTEVDGDAVVAWLVRLARLGLERLTYYPVLIQ